MEFITMTDIVSSRLRATLKMAYLRERFREELSKIEWIAEGHCAGGSTGAHPVKIWPELMDKIIAATPNEVLMDGSVSEKLSSGGEWTALREALQAARKFIRGRHSTLTYGPQTLLDQIDHALAAAHSESQKQPSEVGEPLDTIGLDGDTKREELVCRKHDVYYDPEGKVCVLCDMRKQMAAREVGEGLREALRGVDHSQWGWDDNRKLYRCFPELGPCQRCKLEVALAAPAPKPDELRGEQCEHGWYQCRRCAAPKPAPGGELGGTVYVAAKFIEVNDAGGVVVEVCGQRQIFAQSAVRRASLERDAPKVPALPVPGPVSDDSIHHGPFPAAPKPAPGDVVVCQFCGGNKKDTVCHVVHGPGPQAGRNR
jgi:hypothetical protein